MLKIVSSVVAIYLAALLLGVILYWQSRTLLYPLFKDLIPLLIAVPAAYLGYSFQRRSSYLQALRDLWKTLIPAVQRAVQYTYLDAVDRQEFARVMCDLSIMIDALRGVFKNIPVETTSWPLPL
jgi:hypothetical protein